MVIRSYDYKQVLIGLLTLKKIVEKVLLYVFDVAFPAVLDVTFH